MKTVLTIAGSDCSGGAGIQADLKTITCHGLYGMSAITALTAQNTTGVQGIFEVDADFLGEQLDSIFTDIPPDAIKIGMVSSVALIEVIAKKLIQYNGKNIVVDPVMVSTSGSTLISKEAIEILKEKLIPLATLVTPNIPEAEILTSSEIKNEKKMMSAAKFLGDKYKSAILCKGGHNVEDANDLLYVEGKHTWFYGKKINNPNTHGTGCTLSSAIASNLAMGKNVNESIENSKKYISGTLVSMLNLGAGSGPLNHMYNIKIG
ncbi:MAG: bifunctional hydroxymethylpyrimidine kinase/phosphomethylpyrimidine kinase [Lachnospirales bacterium]